MVKNKSGDNLLYIDKKYEDANQDSSSFYHTKQALDDLLSLKPYYKIGGMSNSGKYKSFEATAGSDTEIIERGKYD